MVKIYDVNSSNLKDIGIASLILLKFKSPINTLKTPVTFMLNE